MNSAPFPDGLFANLSDPDPSGPTRQGQSPADGHAPPIADQRRADPPAERVGSPRGQGSRGSSPEPPAGGPHKLPLPAPANNQSVPNAAKQPSTPIESTKAIRLTPPARRNAPPGTSDKAAERIAGFSGILRDRVQAYIASCGANGSTDDEGEAALSIKPQTYTPRRRELVILGIVVDSGSRRATSSGRSAAVWVLREHAAPPDGGAV
jgi:hypothetical protein